MLGQKETLLTLGIKTQFRGRKNQFFITEWQELTEIFRRSPDLEDYWRMQLDEIEFLLRTTSVDADGDRRRLVLQAQSEVLQDCLRIPEKAAAKAQEMLRPKKVPNLKGPTHVQS